MHRLRTILAAAAIAAIAQGGWAGQSVSRTLETRKATTTVVAIDSATRMVTFSSEGGDVVVWAGPEFRRFNELKVGDKVNLTYYESVVYRLRKPGDPPLVSQPPVATSAGRTLPGGTVAEQRTETVTVKAIDLNTGAVTVTTPGGRTVSRTVENRSNLNGVKVGDRIDVVFTEALLADIERP
jgi:Cu/Ag efflux protein CusF